MKYVNFTFRYKRSVQQSLSFENIIFIIVRSESVSTLNASRSTKFSNSNHEYDISKKYIFYFFFVLTRKRLFVPFSWCCIGIGNTVVSHDTAAATFCKHAAWHGSTVLSLAPTDPTERGEIEWKSPVLKMSEK